jgi:HAD superfamily hydrolase (TIGR01509 family)
MKAIVFDFDGVIADTEPLHFLGFRDVLAEERVELTERDYYDRYLGYDDFGAFTAIGRERGLGWSLAEIRTLIARKAERLRELTATVSTLFPGAADAIRRAADAVPIAIASGALRHEIVGTLQRERLDHLFAAIVAAEDTPESKPSPAPYLTAVARLRAATGFAIAPHDCVAIEDSRWGLESARAAGLRTVAVGQTYDDVHRYADFVIARIADLDISKLRIFAA